MTNAGKWAPWYDHPGRAPARYGGDDIAYETGAKWLEGLHVEDWGCGTGWLAGFVPPDLYTGIDGTASPYADIVADLVDYRSTTEGIFLRHVLEHNDEWRAILDNALASATKRVFVAIFTPEGEGQEIGRTAELDVPDLALPWGQVLDIIQAAGFTVTASVWATRTAFHAELFIEAERC
jgi:hypothetical protein